MTSLRLDEKEPFNWEVTAFDNATDAEKNMKSLTFHPLLLDERSFNSNRYCTSHHPGKNH